jgi:hypothetical protein
MSISNDFLSSTFDLFPFQGDPILAGKFRAGKVSLNSTAGQSTILGYGVTGPRKFRKPLLCIFYKNCLNLKE